MLKIRKLIYLAFILALLASSCTSQAPATSISEQSASGATATATQPPVTQPPATDTPEPVPTLDPALQAAMKLCENVIPGMACLVEGPVQVKAQPDSYLMPFQEAGQILSLAEILSLRLGEAGSTKGIVVMRIQTEWPGTAFTALAFGDVELVNEVPYGSHEFNPFQSLKLATGPNIEGQEPTSGFFVFSPEDGSLSTLVVNGAELSFGSGALLTSSQGGLTIQTMWGAVGVWLVDKFVEVISGTRADLTDQEIEQRVMDRYAVYDRAYETVKRALEKYSESEFWREYWERMNREDPAVKGLLDALKKNGSPENIPPGDPAGKYIQELLKKFYAQEELRRKQKRWKGGWWKMTYGPVTVSGQCSSGEPAGDGGSGGDGEPYSTEIPICKGNNGNTILMYESGVSFDRVGPNLFTQSQVSEFDFFGNGNYTTEGMFMTLKVVSPTRMILSNARTEADSCTTASVVYLDFVRDDPNVRCGEVIYLDVFPWETPAAPTPTPEPQIVDPPKVGPYQVRLGTLGKACDPAAQPFAPSFTTAELSLTEENNLVVDAATIQYELELSTLTYPYYSHKVGEQLPRLGIFTLEQPVDGAFGLMMLLVQMPGQQWSGSWLVSNEDATQICGGSIDLLPPE